MLRRIGYGRDTDLDLRSVFRRTDQLCHWFGRYSGIWYAARPDVAAVGTSDGYPVYLYQHLAGDRGGSGTTCSRHSFPPSGCLAVLADWKENGESPLLFNLRSLSDITCHYLIAVWKGISFRGSGINLNGCSALYPQWSDINGHTVLLRSPVNPTWNDSSNTMKIISRQNTGINLSATSEKIKTYKKSPGSAKLHAIKKSSKTIPLFLVWTGYLHIHFISCTGGLNIDMHLDIFYING